MTPRHSEIGSLSLITLSLSLTESKSENVWDSEWVIPSRESSIDGWIHVLYTFYVARDRLLDFTIDTWSLATCNLQFKRAIVTFTHNQALPLQTRSKILQVHIDQPPDMSAQTCLYRQNHRFSLRSWFQPRLARFQPRLAIAEKNSDIQLQRSAVVSVIPRFWVSSSARDHVDGCSPSIADSCTSWAYVRRPIGCNIGA